MKPYLSKSVFGALVLSLLLTACGVASANSSAPNNAVAVLDVSQVKVTMMTPEANAAPTAIPQTQNAQQPVAPTVQVVVESPSQTKPQTEYSQPELPMVAAPQSAVLPTWTAIPQAQKQNARAPEQPTQISIPAINLNVPVMEAHLAVYANGSAEWVLPKGRVAAWHNNSALLGEGGNLVLNGHNNIEGSVFARLQELKPGMQVIVRSKSRQITYRLDEKELLLERGQPMSVLLDHGKYILPTGDDRLTLVTCWPNTDNSHRLIWIAYPIEDKLL